MGQGKRTFFELCHAVGKGPAFVRKLQFELGLHMPGRDGGFSDAYVNFMEKLVALRTFDVPMMDILDLFVKEKRILEMLRFHTLTNSPTWYLDACVSPEHSETRLLLTGQDLGFPISGTAIQANLDFSDGSQELFKGEQMGEDVRVALALYRRLVEKIRSRVRSETPVLRNALAWSEHALVAVSGGGEKGGDAPV
jgi:hypothetical protein